MKKFEECDGSCQKYCWPILTKRSVLGSLFFYFGFLFMLLSAIFIELSCMQHGIPPVLFYSPHFAFFFMVIISVFRMKTLEKLISHYHPNSWVAKIFFIFFYLIIPYPELRFLLAGEDNVIVRDICLSARKFSIENLAKLISDTFPCHAGNKDGVLQVYPKEGMCITVQVNERRMKLCTPVSQFPIDVPDNISDTFSLEDDPSESGKLLCYSENVCYFSEDEEIAAQIVGNIQALLCRINI